MSGEFIFQGAANGAHIDATMTQNMINNDQVIYDEVTRRPRGLIGYAEILSASSWDMQRAVSQQQLADYNWRGTWNSGTSYSANDGVMASNGYQYYCSSNNSGQNPTAGGPWHRISSGDSTQTWNTAAQIVAGWGGSAAGQPMTIDHYLEVEVEIEDNRLIRVEAMLPYLETVAVGLTHQHGVRIVRDGTYIVGQPTGDHWWGGFPVPDRRGLWMVGFDFPDAGPHTYSLQMNNGGAPEPTYNGGSMTMRGNDRYQNPGEPVSPYQIMVFDMGDTSGMTIPEQTGDSRTRDPISTAKAKEITKNLRRQVAKKDRHRGF